jgi:hypothetical protein
MKEKCADVRLKLQVSSRYSSTRDQLPAEDAAKMKEKCADVRLKLQVSSSLVDTAVQGPAAS